MSKNSGQSTGNSGVHGKRGSDSGMERVDLGVFGVEKVPQSPFIDSSRKQSVEGHTHKSCGIESGYTPSSKKR